MSTEAAKKFVPGAPPKPEAPLSKAQKKKRRLASKKDGPNDGPVSIQDARSAALVEEAPAESDVKSGQVADELLVHDDAPASSAGVEDVQVAKTSPVIEMLNKRIKALGKKIARIHTYSSKAHEDLNEDQKKTLKTLPVLEAVQKELEDTKKATEAIETEEANAASRRRVEAEEAERQRIQDTVEAAQREHITRAAQIMDFIQLHALLSKSDPSTQALNLAEQELTAIFTAAEALLSHGHEDKHDIVTGLFLGTGEVAGIPYLRLLEITENHTNPPDSEPSAPEPADVPSGDAENVNAEYEASVEELAEVLPEPIVQAALPSGLNGPSGLTGATSFSFMQESELDSDAVAFENGAEWVEKEEVTETVTSVIPDSTGSEEGQTVVEVTEVTTTTTVTKPSNGKSWADEDDGLTSAEDVQAHFAASGTATPIVIADQAVEPGPQQIPNAWGSAPATDASTAEATRTNGPGEQFIDEEGFVQARGGRGRGRARGGFRGERGGFRGARGFDRGGYRGGPRPSGDFRGGDRGGRGGYWRGGPDGENRGRGRGRGRGGDRGGYGGRGGRSDEQAQ